jgi:hypothetical protein
MQHPNSQQGRAASKGIGATEFRQRFWSYLSPQKLGAHLRGGRKRKQRSDIKISEAGLIMGRVFHFMQRSGRAAVHVGQVCGRKISDARISQRCQALGVEIFEWVMGQILGPVADPRQHPEAFYRGMRLVGVDGTLFSMFNTPSVLKQLSKVASRRMKAAFAKLGVACLVELGTHRPIAAAIARDGESEMPLARRLIAAMPLQSLLLADRLYGVGKFLVTFLKIFSEGGSNFLVRVKRGKFKSKVLECFRDGSVLLEVWATAEDGGKEKILVREICGTVIGRNAKRTSLRLWTSLLVPKDFPALELLKLYAMRWEHEISFKELKIHLHGGAPLQSYTPETGRQEIAALLICQAMLADLRLEAARRGNIPVLRISFLKVLHHLCSLWEVFSWAKGVLTQKQKNKFVRGMLRSIRQQCSPPRRARSCPRVLRQPVSPWPRKLKNGGSSHGNFHYEISRKIRK